MKKLGVKVLIAFAAALLVAGCSDKSVAGMGTDGGGEALDIDFKSIYVSWQASNAFLSQFKIDFENKKVWSYKAGLGTEFGGIVRRDTTAENEGYSFAGNLSNKKIKDFFEQSQKHGFFSWEERYDGGSECYEINGKVSCNIIVDGTWWGIEIVYIDGAVKKTFGYLAWPETWGDMEKAFEDLVGERVL